MRPKDERHADILFIQHRYRTLAARAWLGFRKYGRGFLLITTGQPSIFPRVKDSLRIVRSTIHDPVPLQYVPAKAIIGSGAEYPVETVEDMIKTYDTDWEIVVVIEQQGSDGWGSYRFAGPFKPKQAYREVKDFMKQTGLPLLPRARAFQNQQARSASGD